MPSAAPCLSRFSARLFALLGALLMATACLQAVGPWPAPLERHHGSAFSAATDDVALAPLRRTDAARSAIPLAPPAPRPALVAVEVPARPRLGFLVVPPATGPPAYPYLRYHPGRRGPPLP